MTETNTATTTRRVLPFVAGAAFMCVLSAGVGAGAATLVTSAQIKNGTIVSVDVKNGSLTGKDLKNGSVSGTDLKDGSVSSADVKDGSVTGADVKDASIGTADVSPELNAAMVDGLIPSGTTVTGFETFDLASDVAADFAFSVRLPGRASAQLTANVVNFAGDDAKIGDASSECTGSFQTPTAPAGQVCLYLASAAGDSSAIRGGSVGVIGIDRSFSVLWSDSAANTSDVYVSFAWAYTAP